MKQLDEVNLVVDEDEDDVWLVLLRSRPVVGFGLLSRQEVQAEEKTPQDGGGGGGGGSRLHVGAQEPCRKQQPI